MGQRNRQDKRLTQRKTAKLEREMWILVGWFAAADFALLSGLAYLMGQMSGQDALKYASISLFTVPIYAIFLIWESKRHEKKKAAAT